MRARWGVVSGSLALIGLEVLITSKQTGRLGELFALPAGWARRLIDPSVPAIPDRSAGAAPAPTPAAPAPVPTAPPAPGGSIST